MNPTFNNTYFNKLKGFYSPTHPQPFEKPEMVIFNPSLAKKLGLSALNKQQNFPKIFSGGYLLPGMQPLAQKYSGHQFGQYNPELGDGRGLLLGELISPTGKKWDMHLKGAGSTPYSRFADGRATLRSCIREYIASESLHALGIPSCRALSVVTSDLQINREKIERAAMVTRVCESHIRFGHFENEFYLGEQEKLQQLVDYTIDHHFAECRERDNPIQAFFETVVQRTAEMIAKWQAFGFNHGVMNTDNMSILGITFDFGPYGFMDDYDPHFASNQSDKSRRYAFDEQPAVGLWNLNALGRSLSQLLSKQAITEAIQQYEPWLIQEYMLMMKHKLGLYTEHPDDPLILREWLDLLKEEQKDYTHSFRALCFFDENAQHNEMRDSFVNKQRFEKWAEQYKNRLNFEMISQRERQDLMLTKNPLYVPRSYLAEQAIKEAKQGNYRFLTEMMAAMSQPYNELEKSSSDFDFSAPPTQ